MSTKKDATKYIQERIEQAAKLLDESWHAAQPLEGTGIVSGLGDMVSKLQRMHRELEELKKCLL